jgi:2-dehydro-3-deoxy-D-gluconate 5-dehydrogenase
MTSLFSLDGRVAIVTGAAGGLGASYAVALAQAGADVAVHDRAPGDATCEAIRALGRRAVAVVGDITDPETPARLVRETTAALGGLDIVVNNAGTIRRSPAAETTDEDWLAVLDVNLSAVFRMCRAAGRHMLAQGRGKIVNVASLLAFQGGILVPAYAASKGGVAQLTKALSNEWAGKGINVNAIAPGYVRTANTAPLQADPVRSRQIVDRIPAGRWAEPEDVAGGVVYLCSAAADYVHGHVLVVDGGWMGR